MAQLAQAITHRGAISTTQSLRCAQTVQFRVQPQSSSLLINCLLSWENCNCGRRGGGESSYPWPDLQPAPAKDCRIGWKKRTGQGKHNQWTETCVHISGLAKMSPQELSVWAKSLNIINANQVNKCTQLSKCNNYYHMTELQKSRNILVFNLTVTPSSLKPATVAFLKPHPHSPPPQKH